MKTIEYARNSRINREDWPSGVWDDEPDKLQWEDKGTGLPCLILRNRLGALCGYVGVSEGHRFYGAGYDDVRIEGAEDDWESSYPPAHGGLTYADRCQEGPEGESICHIVEAGEDDNVWWLGFDCLHAGDTSPGMIASNRRAGLPDSITSGYQRLEVYRDIAYTKQNVEELAAWLAENA